MDIRFATEQDAAGLLAVYAQYIGTAITFETELPTVDGFAGRIRDIRRVYPYLALTDGGRIAGTISTTSAPGSSCASRLPPP